MALPDNKNRERTNPIEEAMKKADPSLKDKSHKEETCIISVHVSLEERQRIDLAYCNAKKDFFGPGKRIENKRASRTQFILALLDDGLKKLGL